MSVRLPALLALLLLAATGCGKPAPPWPDGGGDADADTDIDGEGVCPTGLTECDDGCVDLESDSENCGLCGGLCPAGQACRHGGCGPACEDECLVEGERECQGAGVRECGEHDGADLCFEWSALQACPEGTVCDPESVTCREPCGDFCDPFSIILLPDTQYYTSKQDNDDDNTYRLQMQWIIDHREEEGIQFVIHLGDITNNNLLDQWEIADGAHAMLDEAGVPYSVTTGNHDYFPSSSWRRSDSYFDEYFGQDRFAGQPWYGGAYGSSNANNYTLFEVGALRFMVISLEYAPRKGALCWAEQVIAEHPDRRVIVATHCYLTHDGAYSSGCPDADYRATGASGATVWSELVARHSNIFMVVSGHVGDSEHETSYGNNGNPVEEILVDYQFEAACVEADPARCSSTCRSGAHTGNGWMRQLVFDPRANQVHARTFSVEEGNTAVFPGGEPLFFCSPYFTEPTGENPGGNWYSADPSAPDHDYTFEYDMASAVVYERDDQGSSAFMDRTVNSASDGDQLTPVVARSPDGGAVIVWEDDSSDADGAGNHDILARGLAAGGCSGFADILVNPGSEGDQRSPAMATDAEGNFVVAWADDRDDNGIYQIHARGFFADGSERFARITVNSVDSGQQTHPALAMAPDGRFVVAWEDDRLRDGDAQILVRGFFADGSERFADRSVHDLASGRRISPTLGLDEGGRFVVAWADDSDGNGIFQIHARGFEADGSERFNRFTVNSVADGQQRAPALGVSGAGDFAVAWEDDQDENGDFHILARGFFADGSERFADFRVHGGVGGHRLRPALSMTREGAFAVGWQDDGGGDSWYQIHLRTFDAGGAEVMAERTANRVADGQQLAPQLALDVDGSVVVAWEDDMDNNGTLQILARGLELP